MVRKSIQVLVIVWKSKKRPRGVALEWRKGAYFLNPLLHGTLISVNGNSEFWIYNVKLTMFILVVNDFGCKILHDDENNIVKSLYKYYKMSIDREKSTT